MLTDSRRAEQLILRSQREPCGWVVTLVHGAEVGYVERSMVLVVCLQGVLCWGPPEDCALLIYKEDGRVPCCGRLVFPL
jgi:hypothetical protein